MTLQLYCYRGQLKYVLCADFSASKKELYKSLDEKDFIRLVLEIFLLPS